MNEVKIFENVEFGSVRTIEIDSKTMFCGSDVARALGYADTPKAIKLHCKEDGWVNCPVIDSMGRTQNAKFISEGNVYRLIARSKLPTAEKFESWIFDEVIPEIRKTGSYSIQPTEDSLILKIVKAESLEERALALSEYKSVVTAPLLTTIEEQKPKVEYCDTVLNKDGLMNITTIAKDIGMTGAQLNKVLNEMKIIFKDKGKHWHPYADCIWLIKDGYADYQSYADDNIPPTLKWTEKGRQWIIENIDTWRESLDT